jgi:DNA-binding response OmpR family regulator
MGAREKHHLRNVLIVEDESAIAAVVAEVVDDAGFRPLVTTNGNDGLKRASEQWPDLVLTDLSMPQLNGAGMVRALRQEARARNVLMPPVIVMTAANPIKAREAGADVVLLKPFDLAELDEILHRYLG